jgi:hypothetical protein
VCINTLPDEDRLTGGAEEEKQLILFKRMEDEMVKNSHLEAENQQLKEQLEGCSKDAASDPSPDTADHATQTAKPTEHDHLMDKYTELNKKYQDLEQQMKYLTRKNNNIMQKNRDMKESVRAWQAYADRRQKPKKESRFEDDQPVLSAVPHFEDYRPHIPSSPRSVATVRTPLFLADQGRSSPAPHLSLGNLEPEGDGLTYTGTVQEHHEPEMKAGSASVTPKPSGSTLFSKQQGPEADDLPLSELYSNTKHNDHLGIRRQSYFNSGAPGSSQTTVDEAGDPASRHTQIPTAVDNGDVPQFVSARSVNKRKRGQPSKFEVYGERSDGTPIKPCRVKEEPGSSPPNVYSLRRKDTVDLDAPASGLLKTPRHARPHRSSSAPFSQRARLDDTLDMPFGFEEPEAANMDIRALSEPSDPTDAVNNVLRDIDPNSVAEPHDRTSNKRAKVTHTHGQAAHHILSESGEEPPPMQHKLRLPPSAARAKLNRRLHGSTGPQLHSTTVFQASTPAATRVKVEQNPTPPQSSTRSTKTSLGRSRLREPPSGTRSAAPITPMNDGRPQWQMKASEVRPNARKPAASLKKQEPLRSKKVDELKPSDFKVNPVYNQGYSYAFSETVRKRGDRACLPGCTNLQCCGSTFRKFAEAQGPLSSSQEEALLEDYLGEAYDNMRLTQMASDEREELVLQARTKKMAKESGKHREAYERHRSPPGFWRVDFPTTQEEQEDREKAAQRERELVRERWLEAQRKGGKWIFRDE